MKKHSKKFKVLLVLGPNLNLLGEREPQIYGHLKYKDFLSLMKSSAKKNNIELRIFQSNTEGYLIDFLQKNRKWTNCLLMNPAGLTHTSVSLRDAVVACQYKLVEFHFSNFKKREKFRQISLFSDIADKTFFGEKELSALKALEYFKTNSFETNRQQIKR